MICPFREGYCIQNITCEFWNDTNNCCEILMIKNVPNLLQRQVDSVKEVVDKLIKVIENKSV